MKLRILKADVLFSRLVRERAEWRCEKCQKFFPEGERQGLQCSHLIGRRNKAVRWHPLNAVAHCFYCHKYLTENPIEFHSWIKAHLTPGEFAELTLTAMKPIRLDPAFKAHIERNLQRELDNMIIQRQHYKPAGRLEFQSPYEGPIEAIQRKPRAKKAKAGVKKKIQSRPFPQGHRPLRRAA